MLRKRFFLRISAIEIVVVTLSDCASIPAALIAISSRTEVVNDAGSVRADVVEAEFRALTPIRMTIKPIDAKPKKQKWFDL